MKVQKISHLQILWIQLLVVNDPLKQIFMFGQSNNTNESKSCMKHDRKISFNDENYLSRKGAKKR